jgi:anti-anti-sigma regulatory factor
MLDHVNMVVWAIDAKGHYTFQEGKALGVMGLTPGQLIGQDLFTLYDESSTAGTRRALQGELTHNVIQLGDVFWENWLGPVRDDRGEINGAFGISLNATEMQRAKAELEARLQLIERQQEVIRNLETPILQVWDRVLTLPMIGVVDSRRAARVMDDLLGAVSRTQARFAILDLTGVDVVDTATANHLIAIIRGVRLLGAEGILTGIRPNVAQTVISLGLDLSGIVSLAHLRDGLSLAIRRMAAEKRGGT